MASRSKLSRLLLPLALGLGAVSATAPAAAQERLHLESFGDPALYRLGIRDKDRDEPTFVEGDAQAGVEGSLARGAAPTLGRPFAVTAGLGFGLRHRTADILQIRSEASVPLPVAIGGSAGPMRIWDVDGAHRIRAQVGLGGLEGDHLAKGRGGADVEVEGSLWQGGKYGTSWVRSDIGPYAFYDAGGKATVAPRFAPDKEVALTLPVTAEVRHVEVDHDRGTSGFTSERVSSGLAIKPYDPIFSHGSIELLGAGWEVVHFNPLAGGPPPRLGGVERFDLRLFHADAMLFSPDRDLDVSISTNIGGLWLHDPGSSGARVATLTGMLGGAIHGYPDKKEGGIEVGFGAGALYDAIFLADGSALTRRLRGEGFIEASFMKRRVGGSFRGAVEELMDFGVDEDHHPKRGAVTAEWWLSPIRPLELGLDFTSTEMCVSPQTQLGPAWCHRFGVFLRASARGTKTVGGTASLGQQPVKMEH